MAKAKTKAFKVTLERTSYYTLDVAANDEREAYEIACDTVAANPNRYLDQQGKLLIQDLQEVTDRWSSANDPA